MYMHCRYFPNKKHHGIDVDDSWKLSNTIPFRQIQFSRQMQQITKKKQHDVANKHPKKWFSARKCQPKNDMLLYVAATLKFSPPHSVPLLLDQGTLPRCLCLQASAGSTGGCREKCSIQVGQTIAHTNLHKPWQPLGKTPSKFVKLLVGPTGKIPRSTLRGVQGIRGN